MDIKDRLEAKLQNMLDQIKLWDDEDVASHMCPSDYGIANMSLNCDEDCIECWRKSLDEDEEDSL